MTRLQCRETGPPDTHQDFGVMAGLQDECSGGPLAHMRAVRSMLPWRGCRERCLHRGQCEPSTRRAA